MSAAAPAAAPASPSTPTTEEPLPAPFHNIPGLANFRDLGGVAWPIAGQAGKTVRAGVVYRSSEPSRVTDAGVARLQALGIRRVYDLRSRRELERDAAAGQGRQVREWPGAERVFAPVFNNDDYSPEAIALRYRQYGDESEQGFREAYKTILLAASSGDRPYQAILAHLAAPSPPAPILLHCTAGKDRTGVICALVLALCGVDDGTVAKEYGLTDTGLRSRHPEFLAHLSKDPALKDKPDAAWRMISAREQNILTHLQWIRETYGSVEKCVIDLGLLTADGVEQLRRNLIVDTATHNSRI